MDLNDSFYGSFHLQIRTFPWCFSIVPRMSAKPAIGSRHTLISLPLLGGMAFLAASVSLLLLALCLAFATKDIHSSESNLHYMFHNQIDRKDFAC